MKLEIPLKGRRYSLSRCGNVRLRVTFTIDCMPAYTKFNKKTKVMATLQVIDKTDTSHNYKNKSVLGHGGRTADSDVNKWYTKSVFDEAESGE